MAQFKLDDYWTAESEEHLNVAKNSFETLKDPFAQLLDACAHSIATGGKLLFFGNGGSAADAQHLATEFTVRYAKNRRPMAALALTTDTSTLTAAGNDYGFDYIFARQIEALGRPGDIAIGISTSGKSQNVLTALKQAREMNLITVGFTGEKGTSMKTCCDVVLAVPSKTTARIQEMHITIGQILCGALEKRLKLI